LYEPIHFWTSNGREVDNQFTGNETVASLHMACFRLRPSLTNSSLLDNKNSESDVGWEE
jgi:hypothetical protein